MEIQDIEAAMGRSFVIAGDDSPVLRELEAWLDLLTETVKHDPYISPDKVNRRTV